MRMYIAYLLLALSVIVLLGGCSGSDHARNSLSPGGARASVIIKWPPRTKLIPVASNSIRVAIRDADGGITAQIADRPADGSASTVTFTGLPVGDLTVEAAAYPEPNAQGVAQASGTSPLTTTDNASVSLTFNMSTTIDNVEVTADPTVDMLGSITCTAVAKHGDEVVLTAPGEITWGSSTPSLASIDAQTGVVTAKEAEGTLTIIASEKNSACHASVPLTVVPPAPRVVFEEPFNTLDLTRWDKYSVNDVGFYASDDTNYAVSNGALTLLSMQPYRGGAVVCQPIKRVPRRVLTITKRSLVHYANTSCISMLAILHGTSANMNSLVGSIGYYHLKGYQTGNVLLDSFTIGKYDSTVKVPALWDQWMVEVITYDPATGNMTYSVNGAAPIQRTMTATTDANLRIALTAACSDFSSGQEHHIDNIKVEWK